jgi:hypothetical protein
MQLRIAPDGTIRYLYEETVELQQIGQVSIYRGSHVEPTHDGSWQADLACVGGPVLGPFPKRSQALQAERDWLQKHWLFADTLVNQVSP